jgi:hypothetical protein
MTRRANARLAGFMFLFYIVVGLTHLFLVNKASGGTDVAARLANMAQHPSLVGVSILFTLLESISAFLLGIGLYGLTRDEDRDLALLAFSCRAAEGTINALSTTRTVALLSIATANATTPDPAASVIAAWLFKVGVAGASAFCFALGSTIFCYLFLRSRSIPLWLAWLGLVGSAIVLVGQSLELAGLVSDPRINFMWIPIALFEVVMGSWLLFKVPAAPIRLQEQAA